MKQLLLASLLITSTTSVLAQALTADERARIAKAAETEQGFYETGGAKSEQTKAAEQLVFPDSDNHIVTAQGKIEAKAAAERANQRALEREQIKNIKTERTNSRTELKTKVDQALKYSDTVDAQIAKAEKDIADAKAAQSKSALERVAGQAGFGEAAVAETQLRQATERLNRLKSEKSASDKTLAALKNEVADNERKYQIELVKAEEASRSAETSRRVAQAKEAASAVATQREQNAEITSAFDKKIADYDKQIQIAKANNIPSVVEELENSKRKTIDAKAAAEKAGATALKSNQNFLRLTYEQNRNDGIGPSSSVDLNSKLRKQARAEGGDVNTATNLVDQEAVESTANRAELVASGARKNTEHTSVFNGISKESVHDFLLDMKEDRETMDWTEFSLRMGSYYKGVGRATKDALVDLLNLIKEAGDTAGEAFEAEVLAKLGIESHVFGRENMELLKKLTDKGVALVDPNDPEGDKVAQDAVNLFNKLTQIAKRDLEKRAVGNLRKNLEGVGYVTGTVLGAESIVIEGAILPLKGMQKLRNVWKAEKAVDSAETLADAEKLRVPDVDTSPAQRAKTGDIENWGPKSVSNVRIVERNGEFYAVRQFDGQTVKLEEVVGAGGTTRVYAVPGDDSLVIKITKSTGPLEKAGIFDSVGYKALKGIDPDGKFFEVPTQYSSNPITGSDIPGFEGGTLSITERAPTDYGRAMELDGGVRGPDGTLYKSPTGGMTPGQIIAYDNAMRAINEQGWVWFDNKPGNFAFKHMGGDEWKLVILDPGGMAPAKSPASARAAQKYLDNPSPELKAAMEAGYRGFAITQIYHDVVGKLIDLDLFSKLTGIPLDEVYVPMSGPITGTKYSGINKVTGALAGEANKLKGDLRKLSDGVLTERPLNDRDFVGGKNKGAGPGDSGVHEAAVPRRQLTRVPTPNQPKDKKDEKNNRVVTGSKTANDESKDTGDDENVQILIGDNSVLLVDPMFFEFGGTVRPRTGIATDCPSWCLYLVDQYNELAKSSPVTEMIKQQMHVIKSTTLPLCEAENCGDEDDWDYISKLMNVFPITDLNPYQRQSLVSIGTDSTPPVIVTPPTSPLPPETPDEPETPDTPVTPTPNPPVQDPPQEMTPPLQVTTTGNPNFSHDVGVTECPTNAGTINIRSNNQNALSVSNVAVSGSLSSRLDTRVQGNNSATPSINTEFNCSSSANGNFSGNVTATVRDNETGEEQNISVSATGRVQ